jgi:hypothetical protein
MIHELRTYTLIPGTHAAYLKLAAEVGRPARGDRYGKLEGYWYPEFGTLGQVTHLWSYADLAERQRLRAELARNEAWTRDFLPRARAMTQAQETLILNPVVPLTPPADEGNVYELRRYAVQPARMAEWVELFNAILPTREKYMRRVGFWQSEIGALNEVVHLWVFRDLNERAAVRAELGKNADWQQFLSVSVPMLSRMHASMLVPAVHSPMK